MLIPVAVMGSGEPGEPFNGGTITEPLVIDLADPAAAGLVVRGAGASVDAAILIEVSNDAERIFLVDAAGEVSVALQEDWASFQILDAIDTPMLTATGAGHLSITTRTGLQVGGDIGFFGTSAVPQPAAAFTAQDLYDGLVALGLFGAGGSIGSGVAGVVLRSSTIVGDGTSTVDTDGIVTASGDADMRFNGTGGLFRFSGGLGAFHEAHSWIPAPGDGTDKVCVVYIGPPGDAGSSPAGFGYQMDNGVIVANAAAHIASIRVQDDTCLIASILVPAAATRSDECTITDLRVFVA